MNEEELREYCKEASKQIINLEEENQQLKEQYCERTDCSGRLGNSKKVEELQQENQQLKEQLQQKEDIINKSKDHISKNTNKTMSEEDFISMLLEILDNKGE